MIQLEMKLKMIFQSNENIFILKMKANVEWAASAVKIVNAIQNGIFVAAAAAAVECH
jgi:hypothetical protein